MQTEPQGPSLLVLGRRTAAHWRPAAWVFLAFFLLTAAIAFLLPSQYQTHLKILVKNERVDPLVGADKQTQGILYVNEISEARINTEIQLLTSADVLREVVKQAHLAGPDSGAGVPPKKEEAALRRLQKDLVVGVVRGSNVIEASYESTDPRRSADVLRALWERYMASHRTLHGAPGSYEFFHQLSLGYSAQLAAAQQDLARFGQQHRIVTLPEQKTLGLANIAHLESEMRESTASARKSAQTAEHLKTSIDQLPASVERQRRSMPNQASAEQLTSVLIGLENKRATAELRYQPGDRALKELNTQIEQTKTALDAANAGRSEEVSMGADPAVDSARGEYLRAAADEAGSLAQTRELARQLNEARAQLMAMDEQSVSYRNLQRRVADLDELDDNYRKKSEEARMAELMDMQSISNLAVLERPVEPVLPSSPKRGLIFALGLLWSLAIAVATAVALEMLTERIHTPFELAQVSGMPVLAAVPANAIAPSYGGSFAALYLAMQRPAALLARRNS